MILSITSFPARLPLIVDSLKSIIGQMDGQDRLVLWLGEEKFPQKMADVPLDVRSLCTDNGGRVEIRFVHDIRAFTKLIPAIRAFPNETIVTFDDDVIYDPNTLRLLKEAHTRDPRAIFAHGVSDLYLHHRSWKRTTGMFGHLMSPTFMRMPLGIGGVLYPPNCLHPIATDESLFMKLCPTNDDIWFWYCATKQGTPVRRVQHAIRRPRFAEAGGIDALSAINEVDGDRVNLEYIERLLSQDPELSQRVYRAAADHRLQINISRLHRMLIHYPRQLFYCLRSGGIRFVMNQIKRTIQK